MYGGKVRKAGKEKKTPSLFVRRSSLFQRREDKAVLSKIVNDNK